jgi:hypothetical protein
LFFDWNAKINKKTYTSWDLEKVSFGLWTTRIPIKDFTDYLSDLNSRVKNLELKQ